MSTPSRFWVLLLACSLVSCKPAPDPQEKVGMPLTGINYTAEGVQEFYVNGAWGGNLPSYGGGGKTTCCVNLPRQWTPELKATVNWTMGWWTKPYSERKHLPITEQLKCCAASRTLTQTVPIQKYDEPSKVQVFFLPNDKLEIWVYGSIPIDPNHPSGRPYPKDPRPHDPKEDD